MASLTRLQREALQQILFAEAADAHPLREAIERYRAEHLHVDRLSQSTISWRETALRRLAVWADRPVEGRWRDVACRLYAEHGQASGSLAVNTLNRVLLLARRWGWRQEAPDLEGLARVRSQQRTAVLHAEHRTLLLAELDREEGRRRVAADVVRLVLWTGMRVSEACGVEWDHVALAERRLMLPRTKAKRVRCVPLCAEALEVVDAQPRGGQWVFPARDGQGPVNRRQPEQVLEDVCRAAGLPRTTPHVLRHTWATEAMRAGVPDEVAARALGHSSTKELQRYQHARVEDVAQAMDAVAGATTKRSKR